MGDKVCAFIIGTNCTGKTSAVKEVIRMLGGATSADKWLRKSPIKSGASQGKDAEGNLMYKYGGEIEK